MILLSFGLLVNVADLTLFAEDGEMLVNAGEVDMDFDDDFLGDDLDLDAIRAWEQQNPPSFFKVTGSFIKEHIKKNKVAYLLGGVAAGAVVYYFRAHLAKHTYKYLLGSTALVTFAGLYGKWQFDKYMNKTRQPLEVD